MAKSSIVSRLLWHVLPSETLAEGSISKATYSLTGLPTALSDVLQCMEALNKEVNGAVPSETSMGHKAQVLPRELPWCIVSIVRFMKEAQAKCEDDSIRQELEEGIDRLEYYWLSVLDGDIDDLGKEWELHCLTR